VAACFARERFTLAELSDQSLRDPHILSLAAKTECIKEAASNFPKYFSGAVSVTLADGRTLRAHVPMNLGSGERALSLDEIVGKFRGNAGLRLPAQGVDTVLDALLSATPETPVRDVMRALG
jgi:2-methylcitrate dehydratase PrpD